MVGSPVTRWASIALGAGVGIGSAYSDCSHKFDASTSTSPTVAKVALFSHFIIFNFYSSETESIAWMDTAISICMKSFWISEYEFSGLKKITRWWGVEGVIVKIVDVFQWSSEMDFEFYLVWMNLEEE